MDRVQEEPTISEEIQKMTYEPLLPIEKKLIGWSRGRGRGRRIVLFAAARVVINA